MQWRNTNGKYGLVAVALHWTVAAMILGLLALGLYMTGLKPSPAMFKLFFWHKSFGITVLALATIRLGWRLGNIRPHHLPTHAKWERILARIAHALLYLALFVMPLSGWIMSSAKGFPVSVFGWFTLPNLTPENKDLGHLMGEVHETAAWILIGVIALHAAGAIKHHLIDRDATLRRMLPALALLLLTATGAAAQDTATAPLWTIDPAHSSLTFAGTQMGANFEGSFPQFGGEIRFDPDHLENSRVKITIPTHGIKTGSSERDNYLPLPEWLDEAAFPESVFEATKFEKTGEDQYIAHGTLTLRGATLPLDLPFALYIGKDGAIASVTGETALNRLDYGIGGKEWKDTNTVGNRITVRVSMTANRAP